jgi:ketol-acid reductoisomerase
LKRVKINKQNTMANYFNTLPLRLQLEQLGVCEFMDQSEFERNYCLEGKKSCDCRLWSSRFKPRFNMRDSGLDIMPYVLRQLLKRASFMNAAIMDSLWVPMKT